MAWTIHQRLYSCLKHYHNCQFVETPGRPLITRVKISQSQPWIPKRVIPCLDVHAGQVTRGVQFGRAESGELRNVGDPVELALRYNEQGADEMVFFDITATPHGRKTLVEGIERAADQCFMPLTVGGGVRAVGDM